MGRNFFATTHSPLTPTLSENSNPLTNLVRSHSFFTPIFLGQMFRFRFLGSTLPRPNVGHPPCVATSFTNIRCGVESSRRRRPFHTTLHHPATTSLLTHTLHVAPPSPTNAYRTSSFSTHHSEDCPSNSSRLPYSSHSPSSPDSYPHQPPNPHGLTDSQVRSGLEAAERHKRAHELWQTFVPEKSWGLTSPAFWLMLCLVVTLHLYNNKRDKKRETEALNEKSEVERRNEVERKRQKRLMAMDADDGCE
eukprot:GHVN01011246.1.p1 GENE.GHVN01011246.1~~GHVN01011246.1.p1  ORF type:complete len:249 (-),score=56.77 GHVN01011246.1:497-1243(-)